MDNLCVFHSNFHSILYYQMLNKSYYNSIIYLPVSTINETYYYGVPTYIFK